MQKRIEAETTGGGVGRGRGGNYFSGQIFAPDSALVK